ncbi:cupin [Hyphomicrobium denitrificans 1NES1]|uniref:Cupin n=1 Tax=Hyphomicrobium denitrificans 1NES1 TaxID=670307 RepID=N0B3A0_9HYPH|nr:cupin domain-containing protein [Hyphomicrobium denitrificans]AGK56692.1 cupin [Hyphomicrobium denitrificans 1NES1]
MALHHVKPGEVADLAPLGSKLCDTKTSALAKSNSFEAIRLVVPAGKEIPAHDVPGEITLHCLEGRAALQLDRETIELSAGQWAYLEGGQRHTVKGIEDSSLLLTILFVR